MNKKESQELEKRKLEESEKNPYVDKSFYDEIVKFVSDEFEARRMVKQKYETAWQLNFDFVEGRQYVKANYEKNIIDDIPQLNRERVVINQIAPIIETRRAKLRQLNKFMTVISATSENDDIKNAEISTQLLQNTYEKLNMDSKIEEAVNWAEICGSVFLKSTWDNNAGVFSGKNEDGNDIFSGDIDCGVVSPYELYPEDLSKPNIEDQCSIIHARVFSRNELFYKYGISVSGCENTVYQINSVSDVRKGLDYENDSLLHLSSTTLPDSAVLIEYYEKPTRFYKNGRFIQVCEDKLLYYGALPYKNEENYNYGYPFVKIDCISQINSFFGTSVIPRLIPIQQLYNATQNRINEYLADVCIGVPVIEDGSLTEECELSLDESGFAPGVKVTYNRGFNPPKFMDYNNLPSEFFNTKETLKNDFITVSGVSDVSKSSNVPGAATSGYAIQILQQQDDTRISLTGKNILNAICSVGKQWLYLYKQFVTTERVVRYTGVSYQISRKWSNENINSFDIRVADDNDMFVNTALTRELANTLNQMGYIGQDRYSRLMYISVLKNGDINKLYQEELLDIKNAEKENYIFSDKNEIDVVYDYDDHELHLIQHNIFRKSDWYRDVLLKKNPEAAKRFDEHCALHQKALAQLKANMNTEEK